MIKILLIDFTLRLLVAGFLWGENPLKKLTTVLLLGVSLASPLPAMAGPAEDLAKFQEMFKKLLPSLVLADYANGAYAIDQVGRENWQAIEEFPPYEPNIEQGKKLFEAPFANGKTMAGCFSNGGVGIRQNYPRFDVAAGQVKTLEMDINACRQENGEAPYKDLAKGEIASIVAYMAYTSRGKPMSVQIPDNPQALAAYEKGKQFYYAKRGQLNFSCADCHMSNAGKNLRSEILSPGLGQGTGFPVYRSTWGFLGTLHHRYRGCNEQIRAKPLPYQSEEYRNLEYFQAYMNTGVPVSGPSARK